MELPVFERAVEGVQSGDDATRAAAEAVLLAVRDGPDAVAVAQGVLSQTASPSAQFQALLALKVGILRDWGTTSPAEVDALRTQVRDQAVAATARALTLAARSSRSFVSALKHAPGLITGASLRRLRWACLFSFTHDWWHSQLLEFTVGGWDGLAPFVRSQLLVLVSCTS